MSFIVNNREFANLLSVGGAMANKAKTVPVLRFAKVSISGLDITVESFDLENAISCKGQIVKSDCDMNFLVDPFELSRAISTLSDETVDIDVTNATIIVSHSSGKMELPICQDNDFPKPNQGDAEQKKCYEVDTIYLHDRLSDAINFVAEDTFRPALCGVLLYKEFEESGVCATDAHKLYKNSFPFNGCSEDFRVVLSTTAIKPLLNISKDEPTIQMMVDDKNITFNTSRATLTTRIVEGVYPNFNAILPQSSDTKVKVSKSDLLSSMKRVGLFASKITSQVKLSIEGDVMTIVASDFDTAKQAKESLGITRVGNDISIAAKANFFNICLSAISGEDVQMSFTTPNKPIVFKDKDSLDKVIMLMPMLSN